MVRDEISLCGLTQIKEVRSSSGRDFLINDVPTGALRIDALPEPGLAALPCFRQAPIPVACLPYRSCVCRQQLTPVTVKEKRGDVILRHGCARNSAIWWGNA